MSALSLDIRKPVAVGEVEEYGMRSLKAKGFVDCDFQALYRKAKGVKQSVELLFRPYWSFANREECDMLVWVRKE
ncbi:MAG: hypothetical protein IIX01_02520 [Clostridia bacterium]|nr:hypothetical protein [Clostridia bacterium]